jgi:hypothetical protein
MPLPRNACCRELRASLQGEEATLYDCMSASLESLATYLLTCQPGTRFSWPHRQLETSPSLEEVPSPAHTPCAATAASAQQQGQAVLAALERGWGGMEGVAEPSPGVGGGDGGDSPARAPAFPAPSAAAGTDTAAARESPKKGTTTHAGPQVPSAFQAYLASPASRLGDLAGVVGDARLGMGPAAAGLGLAGPAVMDDQPWDLAELITAAGLPGSRLVPLLERFSVDASVQVARAVHPRLVGTCGCWVHLNHTH